ncbi:General control protein [Vermiconidia calcicola]|uniref:General control protein n=1 Tax=Vermiconidia calcicola TaxID=1690605 RepID=A0ACC3MJX7_9PEZI|nr:General control protein [Vermiconidia calcicola]
MLSEINVAYEGTFGDLSSAGDAGLFGMSDNTDFHQLMASTDGFTPINDGRTVSPKDLFNNESFPPSSSFTNLTTPGSTLLETPDEDYQTSPLFNDNLGIDSQGADNWFSLFPDDNGATPAPFMARTTSASSANQIVVHPGGEGNRKRSSTQLSPSPATFSPVVKHSSVAGVNARKRDKPLPPIVVDENDQTALKRARNTAAARKSRAKKLSEREVMETEIADLKAQVEHWKKLALEHMGNDESMSEQKSLLFKSTMVPSCTYLQNTRK